MVSCLLPTWAKQSPNENKVKNNTSRFILLICNCITLFITALVLLFQGSRFLWLFLTCQPNCTLVWKNIRCKCLLKISQTANFSLV